MNAIVNGSAEVLTDETTIADLVVRLGHQPEGRGLAVALNGDVVSRAEWRATKVSDGDRVEVLIATQGG